MGDNQVWLGMRIKQIRTARKLSQELLAEHVGITTKHLSYVEMGRGFPSLQCLDKMATALGIELRQFFDFDGFRKDLMSSESIAKMLSDLDDTKKLLVYKFLKSLD